MQSSNKRQRKAKPDDAGASFLAAAAASGAPASGSASPAAGSASGGVAGSDARKRKKEKVKDLEERVDALEHENLQLRLQLQVGKESVQRDAQEKLEITQRLDELIARNAPDSELQSVLETYVKKFSDYGAVRTESIQRHMQQLERLLLPTQVTKMCMWSLHQDDDFYAASAEHALGGGGAGSIWSIIMSEIGASDEQRERIKEHRNDARLMAKNLRFTLRECDDLRRKMERKNHALGEEMRELQKVLTPTQLAKFILWVNKNPASMAMLDKLWSPIDVLSSVRSARV